MVPPIDRSRPAADSTMNQLGEPCIPASPTEAGEAIAPGRRRVTFPIPSDTAQTSCRSCGAPGYWIETNNGRPLLVNPNGEAHFATCPDAKHWRKAPR